MHLFAYYWVCKNWHVKLKNQTINYKPVNSKNTKITENKTDWSCYLLKSSFNGFKFKYQVQTGPGKKIL